MTNVIVGTGNPQKRDAIRDAFEIYFDDVNVTMINVSSEVPKQPMNSEITRGAENRINNMKPLVVEEKCDFLVSVEAGIMRIGKRYYNLQYVLIENVKTGKKSTGISQMLEIPKRHIKLAAKTSINNVFRKVFGNDKIDGISIFTRGEAERGKLIQNGAVMALAGQLNCPEW